MFMIVWRNFTAVYQHGVGCEIFMSLLCDKKFTFITNSMRSGRKNIVRKKAPLKYNGR